jgi:hypothetical protein
MTSRDPNQLNYRILGVPPQANLEELKAAYHRAAKQTHPDLAPPSGKRRCELKMMRLNEAYMAILAERMRADGAPGAAADPSAAAPGRRGGCGPAAPPGAGAGDARPPRSGTEVARPRDPGYTYYKLGFDYYRRGYTELYSKDPRIIRTQLAELKTYDHYLLTLTISALKHFERSYGYFSLVLEQAPESIWVADARAKLRKLEKFNRIYQRICGNLSRSLRAKRESDAPAATEQPS